MESRETGMETSDLERYLVRGGYRCTRQRRAVLGVVAAATTGVTAVEVYDAAREECPELGLATVYRTLEILDDASAVRRVHGTDHCERFVVCGEGHGHAVVCSACGQVTEFTACDMSTVMAAAARQTGYAIADHFLQLSGVCATCRARDVGKAAS
jgi:Fur family transcriptional regulator, ferric uptake regulator